MRTRGFKVILTRQMEGVAIDSGPYPLNSRDGEALSLADQGYTVSYSLPDALRTRDDLWSCKENMYLDL